MRNIIINEAESIFEVLWNHGEPGTQKYCSIDEWTVEGGTYGKRIGNAFDAVQFAIYPNKDNKTFPFWLERDCKLDISEYDTLILRGSVSKRVHFRCVCRVDGVDKEVIFSAGTSTMREYNGSLDGKEVTHIRLEFESASQDTERIQISWLGLAHSGRLKTMLARKTPYTPDWPGCFEEKAVFEPQLGLYFGKEDMAELRKKAESETMKPTMDAMRQQALKDMRLDPESWIADGVDMLRPFNRDRDRCRPMLTDAMMGLAFVGLIDENEEMLRMAGRMALAASHCRYFADGYMTGFPGATWHDRSFAEKYICLALAKVLDWAGGVLTWHAKDVIQDAIIMKGIPRIDADLKTLDDILWTNQGLTFCGGLITALVALCPRYPRYKVRVEEAERDLMEMLERYVRADGGISEGGSYWNFTLGTVTEVLLLLSRYHGKSLAEYAPEPIRRMASYGEAIWSEVGNGFTYVPFNDVMPNAGYNAMVVNLMAKIGAGAFWCQLANRMNRQKTVFKGSSAVIGMLLHEEYGEEAEIRPNDFISLDITGVTALRRRDSRLGRTALYAISGYSFPGHQHQDKGSVLLETDGKFLLIDRGVPAYGYIETTSVNSSEAHNVVTAVRNGIHLSQHKERFDITEAEHGDQYSGYVLKSTYENGTFFYQTDLTACWKDIFEKNVRTVTSDDVHHYVIHDSLVIGSAYEVCFILNTYGQITRDGEDFLITDGDVQLRVRTTDWTADRVEFGPYKTDRSFVPVNRLCLYKGGQESYELTTELELRKL